MSDTSTSHGSHAVPPRARALMRAFILHILWNSKQDRSAKTQYRKNSNASQTVFVVATIHSAAVAPDLKCVPAGDCGPTNEKPTSDLRIWAHDGSSVAFVHGPIIRLDLLMILVAYLRRCRSL